jgi:hypothetical protein
MYLGVVPFAAGLFGLAGFWFLRTWEVRRGLRLWEGRREELDKTVADAYRGYIAGDALHVHRARFFAFIHTLTHQAVVALVALLRAVERPLARLSYRMRIAPPPAPNRQPSEFLKTLASEKSEATDAPSADTL